MQNLVGDGVRTEPSIKVLVRQHAHERVRQLEEEEMVDRNESVEGAWLFVDKVQVRMDAIHEHGHVNPRLLPHLTHRTLDGRLVLLDPSLWKQKRDRTRGGRQQQIHHPPLRSEIIIVSTCHLILTAVQNRIVVDVQVLVYLFKGVVQQPLLLIKGEVAKHFGTVRRCPLLNVGKEEVDKGLGVPILDQQEFLTTFDNQSVTMDFLPLGGCGCTRV